MNARKEILPYLIGKTIKCAWIKLYDKAINLQINYNKEELDEFINKLDIRYDNGYGSQELFGIVWLDDGTWLERGEYDGSEWWEYKTAPNIPIDLHFKN